MGNKRWKDYESHRLISWKERQKMEYEFYMFAPITPQDFAEYIKNIFINKLDKYLRCTEDSQYIYIMSDFLGIWVNVDTYLINT